MFWLTYDSENTLGVSAVPLGPLCLLIHASASPTMCAIVVSSFYSSLTTCLILYLYSSYFCASFSIFKSFCFDMHLQKVLNAKFQYLQSTLHTLTYQVHSTYPWGHSQTTYIDNLGGEGSEG